MLVNNPGGLWKTLRSYLLCSVLGTATVLAVVVGCHHEHRIGINEFIALRDSQLQQPVAASEPAPIPGQLAERPLPVYRIGAGDTLGVTVIGVDAPASTTIVRVRVTREGEVLLPYVGAVKVDAMEIEDAERAIANKFIEEQISKTVSANIEVLNYDITEVVVVGAVGIPGLTQLHRNERNIFYAVARANGFNEVASGRVTVRRIRNPAEEQSFDLHDPAQVRTALAIAPLETGDRVMVESAEPNTIYVGGLVRAPGPKQFAPGTSVNVMQILAMSGGVMEEVAPREATLVRHVPDGKNGKDIQVKLDLDRIKRGKDPNFQLVAGDIFWVPETAGTKFLDFINKHVNVSFGVGTSYDPVQFDRYSRLERQQEWNFRNTKRAAYLNPLSGIGSQQVINPFNFLGFTAAPLTPVVPTTGGS